MKDFELMLAPMEKYSTPELREACYKSGADSTFTEMARISALARDNKSTWEKIKITNNVPTYIQLIGSNEKELVIFLNKFKPEPGFLGFNLNLGCPAPDMVSKGYGCALIKRVSKVKKLIDIIHRCGYGASIKLNFSNSGKTSLMLISATGFVCPVNALNAC